MACSNGVTASANTSPSSASIASHISRRMAHQRPRHGARYSLGPSGAAFGNKIGASGVKAPTGVGRRRREGPGHHPAPSAEEGTVGERGGVIGGAGGRTGAKYITDDMAAEDGLDRRGFFPCMRGGGGRV